MRIRVLLSLLLVAGSMVAGSCRLNVLRGEGNKTVISPTLSAFDAVEIDMTVKTTINIQPGVQPGVVINGYENILKHIRTKVVRNKLRIYSDLDETWSLDNGDVTVTLSMPSLTGLTMSGAADADIHGDVTGQEFKLNITGASSIKMDKISVDKFYVTVSGAGDVVVSGGAVKYAEYEINGAGDLKAFPLQATETVATISGAGSSEVTALQRLTANINGAGSIKYKGHPSVSQRVSGVGSISDAN